MPKRTLQPKNKRKKRRHGFRARQNSPAGKKIIKRRRRKGRKHVNA